MLEVSTHTKLWLDSVGLLYVKFDHLVIKDTLILRCINMPLGGLVFFDSGRM